MTLSRYTSAYTSDIQAHSLAVSHDRGTTWIKFDVNPALTRHAPAFRDPNVFRYGGADGRWVLISVEADDERAHIFTSHDLRT